MSFEMGKGFEPMTYEWMIKPMPQREWIEGEGKLIWLALFFVEVGAGLFFFSILVDNLWGMLLGWFFVLLPGGGSFLVHMGKPLRAFRAIMRPQTSWISRGVIFISFFGLIGAVQMIILYLTSNVSLTLLKILSGTLCFLVAIYGGVLMSYIRAIPLWNTGLLPATYITAGFWGGAELLMGIMLITGGKVEVVEPWIQVLLPFFILLVILYLMSVRYSSITGSDSVKRILSGDLAPYFYLGVVIVGLIFPLAVLGYSVYFGFSSIDPSVLVAAILAGLIGDLTMRYCIMKGALYSPLIDVTKAG